jgi:hypothetical protein
MKKALVVVAIFSLCLAGAAFAQGSKAKTGATAQQASGTITSVDATSLVLKHKVGGKEQDTTFIVNADTKKEGELKAGEKATVHYKAENGQNVATSVKVTAAAPKKK